jgi:hypothetical protein
MGNGMQRSYVSAGSLVIFEGQVCPGLEHDVLTSTLALQLGATNKHDRFSGHKNWFETYLTMMSVFGYEISRRDVQSVPLPGQGLVWDSWKVVLTQWLSAAAVEQVGQAFVQLQDGEARALELFQSFSRRLAMVNGIQATSPPVSLAANEPLAGVSLQLIFVHSKPIVTQVFISFKASCSNSALPSLHELTHENIVGNLELALLTAELDEARFNRVRDGLLKKLGPRRTDLVIRLSDVER